MKTRTKQSKPLLASVCLAVTFLASAPGWALADGVTLQLISRYQTGIFDEGAAEIVAHDVGTQRLFVVNGATASIDVLDISDPYVPSYLGAIPVLDYLPQGGGIQSVAIDQGIVAVAARHDDRTKPGSVLFFNADGQYLNRVKVDALPDMLTFTPDGQWLLTANEGEPSDDYKRDPHGTVSIIDMSAGAAQLTESDVRSVNFNAFNTAVLDPSIRIFGPGATVAKDLEPEYIAVSPDSTTAWVTLQENNALAIIDIQSASVLQLVGLGFKDHNSADNGLDASDRDGIVNIANWPVLGMYQPDAIASYLAGGDIYLVMANEGDARDYDGFSEETRVGSLTLDPTAFPDAADLKKSANLGRLRVTNATGDTDGDGDFDQLYSFGARSFSIRDAAGTLVFDSGDQFELVTDMLLHDFFNANSTDNAFDNRSDDKGPEPEGVALAEIDGRTYAFIGLERIGGIMIYDVTDPYNVSLPEYVNTRDFTVEPGPGVGGDLAPEGLLFIRAADTTLGEPLLVVANEVSGTTAIYRIAPLP